MLNRAVGLAGTAFLACASIACGQHIDVSQPRAEAEYLSLEITGQLKPSVALADQIQADLAAIRLAYPQYSSIRVRPDWLPGETLIGMTPEAYADFKAGSFHSFDSIYATLGTPTITAHDPGQWLHLQFGQMYHGVRLSDMFDPVTGVRYAEPNGIIGDGDDIVARANRSYTLIHGFGDCPAGCITHQKWDFTVTDHGVFPGLPPPTTDGDYNEDGVVDSADYVLLRNGWGSLFGQSHYDAWRNHFGGAPASAASISNSLVPEPTSSALLILGLALSHLFCGLSNLPPLAKRVS
jgi:hypothetical protein